MHLGAGGINEVQYAAFLMMIAKATGYKPGQFTHVVCNEQIYDRHMNAAKELIRRGNKYGIVIQNPVMSFTPSTDDFYSFGIDDFRLEGYKPVKPQIELELGI